LIRPARENGHLLKQAMQLLVILGWDGAGKSTLVFPLGELKGPAADQRKFFPARLVPPARERWIALQQTQVQKESWNRDGASSRCC
jgi:ABC-type lipoprotein export system ATPase subunit